MYLFLFIKETLLKYMNNIYNDWQFLFKVKLFKVDMVSPQHVYLNGIEDNSSQKKLFGNSYIDMAYPQCESSYVVQDCFSAKKPYYNGYTGMQM